MTPMSDCIYIVTQEELDTAEAKLRFARDLNQSIAEFSRAISELAEAIWKTVIPTCEEILKDLADILLGLADAAEGVYSPRPKPKRPQRNLFLRYEPMLDKRVQIHKYRRR